MAVLRSLEGRWLEAAVVVGVAICCFAGLAISAALQPDGPLAIFNPDRERLAAAAFSGAVLAAFLLAGLAVLLCAAAAHPQRAPSAIPVTLRTGTSGS